MIVALALFEEDIAPRLDWCVWIALFDPERGVDFFERVDVRGTHAHRRLEVILAHRADVLLCGGIRRRDRYYLEAACVRVISNRSGDARRCLRAYLDGAPPTEPGRKKRETIMRGFDEKGPRGEGLRTGGGKGAGRRDRNGGRGRGNGNGGNGGRGGAGGGRGDGQGGNRCRRGKG